MEKSVGKLVDQNCDLAARLERGLAERLAAAEVAPVAEGDINADALSVTAVARRVATTHPEHPGNVFASESIDR